jgi:hypothetical protein
MADSLDKDKSTFTEGVYPITPIGGVVNETLVGDVAEDNQAAIRITPKRAMHNNARKSDGQEIASDARARFYLSPLTLGTNTPIVRVISINAGASDFYEYVVPPGNSMELHNYYSGGLGGGVASLIKHNDATVQVITNGGMETAPEVAAWAAVTGTFTAPSPDPSAVQVSFGSFSQRWIYASSSTALQRKQTFSSPIDVTGWRYIRASFFCDAPAGGNFTRTVQIILGSNGSTRVYTTTIVNPQLLTPAWNELVCEIDNPTSITGTTFDPTQVSDISIYMKDSANRTGTVYWDYVRFQDSITVLHRVYLLGGLSSPQIQISPSEVLAAGEKIYMAVRNTGAARTEFTSVVKGVLF